KTHARRIRLRKSWKCAAIPSLFIAEKLYRRKAWVEWGRGKPRLNLKSPPVQNRAEGPSLNPEQSCWISLLLVVKPGVGNLLARRIASTHRNRAALAVRRNHNLRRGGNLAVFLVG